MAELDRFHYELQLSWRVAKISRQMTELRRLRELVRIAERQDVASTERASPQSENRRSDFRRSALPRASAGAYPALTTFLLVDPDSEILVSPVGMTDVLE